VPPTVTINPDIPKKLAKPLPDTVTVVPPLIEPVEGDTAVIVRGMF